MSVGACAFCALVSFRERCNGELVCAACLDLWCQGYAAGYVDGAVLGPDPLDDHLSPIEIAEEAAGLRNPKS